MITLDDVRAGLDSNEFFLQYLPTIRLDDGRCVGCEALIRWRRPGGVVPPNDFIPLVENTPLSGLITYWVIERVADDLGEWLGANHDQHVGINVPPEVIGRGGVEYAARKSGLIKYADNLLLEVTERGIPDKLGIETINAVAKGGGKVKIAVDDVGSTDVGLEMLAQVNVAVLKLDKSMVDKIGIPFADQFIRDLVELARMTGAEVIAEGVEKPAQAVALRQAGVAMAQGWLYSHPLPPGGFTAFHLSRQMQPTVAGRPD